MPAVNRRMNCGLVVSRSESFFVYFFSLDEPPERGAWIHAPL